MFRSHPDRATDSATVPLCRRGSARGMTLAELMMAIVVTSIISMVLAGLVLAVQTAHEFGTGHETATSQAQASQDRIRQMVSQAGIYKVGGQPTVLGLAVVTQPFGTVDVANILVVWSGGRDGGMAAAGVQNRLPTVNELVIYAPDPTNSARFVEITAPGDTTTIDFQSPDFAAVILAVIRDASSLKTLLCDRVHVTAGNGADDSATNVWFQLEQSPTQFELEATAPNTDAWLKLRWAQGMVSSGNGLRQATVGIEMQIEQSLSAAQFTTNTAIPFFGSAQIRYVYEP